MADQILFVNEIEKHQAVIEKLENKERGYTESLEIAGFESTVQVWVEIVVLSSTEFAYAENTETDGVGDFEIGDEEALAEFVKQVILEYKS